MKVAVDGIAVPSGDSTGGANNLSVQWNNMLPGADKTVSWTVTNTGTSNESIWLAFDNSNGEWGNINQLGQYGDAKINSPLENVGFNNLNNEYPQTPSGCRCQGCLWRCAAAHQLPAC